MAERKYTREYCEKVVSTCTTKPELKEKHPSVYNALYRHGYHDLLKLLADGYELGAQKTAQKLRQYTKKRCRDAALKCKTLRKFRMDYPGEYHASKRLGIFSKFYWLKRNEPEKNVCIYVYEFPDFKIVYVGLTNDPKRRDGEHRRFIEYKGKDRSSAVYKFCRENVFDIPDMKILISGLPAKTKGRRMEDKYVKKYRADGWTVLNKAKTGTCGAIGTNAEKWTPELIWKEVYKYTSYNDFRTQSEKVYVAACRLGMLEEIKAYYGYNSFIWTPELIWKEVYKYASYNDFRTHSINAYEAARRKGMLPEIKAYYEYKPTKWTPELIWKEVYKYNSYTDFLNLSINAYAAAYHRGMLPEIKAYYAQKKRA